MKKLNTSTRFLIAHVFLCSAFVASVTTAQAQVTPQPEEGAINTSRSNIKNTSRAARGSFDPLVLDLYKKGSGQKIASHKLVDSDGDGTLSELEGAFAFRNLPEGEYVLLITSQLGAAETANRVASQNKRQVKANEPIKIALTLDGIKGGSTKTDLELIPTGSSGDTARTKRVAAEVGNLSGTLFGPGQTHWGNAMFTTDGTTEVKGRVRHDLVKSTIQNMR